MADMALKQPIMVSRLPKFGSRNPAATGPVLNSSAIPMPSAGGKGVPLLKQNGVVRVPSSLSAKWKKGREDEEEKVLDHGGQQPLRSTVSMKEIRKPSASSLTKTRRLVPTTTTTTTTTMAGAGTRNIPQSTRANPRSSTSKQASLGRTGVNGLSSSSSIQGSLEGGLSQSSDSLKSDSAENVVRSQSFSYVKTPASSTGPHLTRSFSFNRAAELAKELPRPLAHSPLARSPITQPSQAISGEKGDSFDNAKTTVTASVSCPLPSTALKKSLLPSCPGNKPSALSYRLTRPSLIKQPLPVLAGKVQLKSGSTKIKLPTSEMSSNTESAGNSPDNEASCAKEADGMQEGLEVQEDMSLSSTSSLERNDGSEEYIDDFDDLGNGGVQMLPCFAAGDYRPPGLCEDVSGLLSQDGSSVSSLHSFLSENVDWAEMGLTGGREGLDVPPRRTSHSLSTGPDLPHGSSLDLSPSDSSGGTYMWDEEVLEPLGGGAHGCGSFDSDLNSMDILNNLENLASCDLEEDDLMLDAELPEDVSLHSDGERMSYYERSEGGYWSSQWRRRQQQQRWGRKEQILTEHRVERHAHSLEMAGSTHTPEEELMHMLLDCSSVKEQLLQLRRLLQAEDDAAVDSAIDFLSSPSSEESSCQQQVQELLMEVQELREQLKQKERLITTLTQLTSAPPEVTQCHCQREDQVRPGQQEKGTQTPWRTLNPQVSQSSRPSRGTQHSLAMSPSSAPRVPPSDSVDPQPGDRPVSSLSGSLGDSAFSNAFRPPAAAALTTASAPASARPCATPLDSGSDELSLLLTAQLRISDLNSPTSPRTLPQRRSIQSGLPHAPLGTNAALPGLRDGPLLGTRRGPQSSAGLIPSVPARLPPPSRGLPCIISASRAPGRDLTSRLPKPKTH